jgi:hypothetical protein
VEGRESEGGGGEGDVARIEEVIATDQSSTCVGMEGSRCNRVSVI